MAKQNPESNPLSRCRVMRMIGVFLTIFSLVAALLILFVIPGNNYASSLILLVLSSSFFTGLGLIVATKVLHRRIESMD